MTPRALHEALMAGTAPAVLDVRTRAEYDAGHVPGALNIPFDEVGRRSRELDAFRDRPLLLYCGHGPRAWIARVVLRRRRFSRLELMNGHMAAWRRARLPEDGARSKG